MWNLIELLCVDECGYVQIATPNAAAAPKPKSSRVCVCVRKKIFLWPHTMALMTCLLHERAEIFDPRRKRRIATALAHICAAREAAPCKACVQRPFLRKTRVERPFASYCEKISRTRCLRIARLWLPYAWCEVRLLWMIFLLSLCFDWNFLAFPKKMHSNVSHQRFLLLFLAGNWIVRESASVWILWIDILIERDHIFIRKKK